MAPPPLFISQINFSLLAPQHRLQSTIHYSQKMVSSPCSSSSSSNSYVKAEQKEEEEEEEKEVIMEVSDGYCTPTSPGSRILASGDCPLAPKKPRVRRRSVARHCSYRRRVEFVHRLGLVVFKEIRCLQKRKKTARRKLGLVTDEVLEEKKLSFC